MSNPNNCATCKHIKHPQGGHCYMFRHAPTERCHQHKTQPNMWQQFLEVRAEIEGRQSEPEHEEDTP